MTTYGFARNIYDDSDNYRFDKLDKELIRYPLWPGRWPRINFVPEVVKMLLCEPTSLKDLVERAHELNRVQSFESNILDIPRQLLEGLEVGAIVMKEIK